MRDDIAIEVMATIAAAEKEDRLTVAYLVRKARDAATFSLKSLAIVDPHDGESVKFHQDEIKRYAAIIQWMRELLRDGQAELEQMTEADREAVLAEIHGDDPGYVEEVG